MSALQYPPLSAAFGAISRVENGLAGGAAAGLVAIGLYLYGRRFRSREKKFRLADMLCVELAGMRDAMPDYAPDASLTRFRTKAYDMQPRAGAPADGGNAPRRHAPGRLPRDAQGMVYTGLLISGNLSHFEPDLQARLHALYGHIERGEYDAAGPLLRPVLREVASFRGANAPFSPADLARPLSLVLSVPRGLRGRISGRREKARGG